MERDGGKAGMTDSDHTGMQSGHMLKVTVDEKGQGEFEYFGPLVEFK